MIVNVIMNEIGNTHFKCMHIVRVLLLMLNLPLVLSCFPQTFPEAHKTQHCWILNFEYNIIYNVGNVSEIRDTRGLIMMR